MITILVDHNIEGQALMLRRTLDAEAWPDLLSLKFLLFSQVGLSDNSNDREVWRFAQQNNMVLLTANRNMNDEDSLEKTIREENTHTSFPVITIGNVKRMTERTYQENCGTRLIEILVDLDDFLGTGRIYIP